MDINFFRKKLSYCISNNKKIIILGRGFSTSLFLKKYKKVKDNNIIIGFNTNEIIDRLWMSESNLKEISKKGHLIGLHSFSHPTRISKLNYHEQKNEYVTNYRHLENLVGKIVSMSHPCGDYNSDTLSILKDLGIQIGFRSSLEPNEIKSKYEIPREDHVNILNQMKL